MVEVGVVVEVRGVRGTGPTGYTCTYSTQLSAPVPPHHHKPRFQGFVTIVTMFKKQQCTWENSTGRRLLTKASCHCLPNLNTRWNM